MPCAKRAGSTQHRKEEDEVERRLRPNCAQIEKGDKKSSYQNARSGRIPVS
jgi:hypothetical protein